MAFEHDREQPPHVLGELLLVTGLGGDVHELEQARGEAFPVVCVRVGRHGAEPTAHAVSEAQRADDPTMRLRVCGCEETLAGPSRCVGPAVEMPDESPG